jgi:hypothetical protein
MEEDEGVLRNLPRSRPGTRSERRTKDGGGKRPAKAAERAAERAERGGGPAARPARGTEPTRAAGGSGQARAGGPQGDPVGDALRAAAKLAGTGLRVTAGLAQEVVRRLPRS